MQRLTHMWEHIRAWFDRDPKKVNIHPYRDWGVIFTIGVILLLVIVGVHYYLFVSINEARIFQVRAGDTQELRELEKEELERVLAFYREQEETFTRLIEMNGLPSSATSSEEHLDTSVTDSEETQTGEDADGEGDEEIFFIRGQQ